MQEDQEGIIDDFMRIKGDGHIQFYTEAELERLFVERGFHKERVILTKMEFPFAPGQAYMELYEGLTDRERQLYDMAEKMVLYGSDILQWEIPFLPKHKYRPGTV